MTNASVITLKSNARIKSIHQKYALQYVSLQNAMQAQVEMHNTVCLSLQVVLRDVSNCTVGEKIDSGYVLEL